MAADGGSPPAPRLLKDGLNALLMLAVIVPPALLTAQLRFACAGESPPPAADAWGLGVEWLGRLAGHPAELLALPAGSHDAAISCQLYRAHPLLLVNLFYLVIVDVGFYVIYLLQGSTWLIDPHW